MYKFALSVRAWGAYLKFAPRSYDPDPDLEVAYKCYMAAELARGHHNGWTPLVELYRAAGFGVFEIYARLCKYYPVKLDKVRERCERFDLTLHELRS